MASERGEYAFGDDEAAARRLDALAELWAPLTERFVRAHGPQRPALALDLGCGPGHTTRLLADVLRPARTVGLDTSPAYVERARARYPAIEFHQADVTAPLPGPPPTLIYARFLLAHLSEPALRVAAWAQELAPGGLLLLEEGERMSTDEPVCARYLELVDATLAAEGKELFPGATLSSIEGGDGWGVRRHEVAELRQPARRFAALFLPNLAQWGPRALDAGLTDAAELDRLRDGLQALLAGPDGAALTSRMRQVVIERR